MPRWIDYRPQQHEMGHHTGFFLEAEASEPAWGLRNPDRSRDEKAVHHGAAPAAGFRP
jgi:hypothetical protein